MKIKLQAPSAKHQGNSKLQAPKGALVACGLDASLEFEVWSLEFSLIHPLMQLAYDENQASSFKRQAPGKFQASSTKGRACGLWS